MADRIADVWGERTPFAAGGDWPERVDQFLAEVRKALQVAHATR